ncbi:hypothetical protein [Saccharopolyspora sp. NPDC050642]|uniref:hypothetical protein n=1 Tax=Saccharopolyspora sp. NPDC050642 TaxID=3157099 RepID=UPI0033C50BC6
MGERTGGDFADVGDPVEILVAREGAGEVSDGLSRNALISVRRCSTGRFSLDDLRIVLSQWSLPGIFQSVGIRRFDLSRHSFWRLTHIGVRPFGFGVWRPKIPLAPMAVRVMRCSEWVNMEFAPANRPAWRRWKNQQMSVLFGNAF